MKSMRKPLERAGKRMLARLVALFLDRRRITVEEFAHTAVSRLLVIRQHNQMGDMILASPAFRGLRRRFPSARITLIAAPINEGVAARNPFIDEVLTYEKRRSRRNPFALPLFVAELRRRRFDAVIVLNTVSFSITSMLLAAVSGARVRIGSTSRPFGHNLSARFYHLELPLPAAEEIERMHESRHNLYPLEAIGVEEDDLTSEIAPLPEEECDAERFIESVAGKSGPFIVVHPGAGKRQNIWPPERFAATASHLNERYGATVIAVRGPADGPVTDAFLAACYGCYALLDSPSVGFLASLMKRAACTVCNDTGIMHIAGAAAGRCVAIFGPTDPRRWKPVNEIVSAVQAEDGSVESVPVEWVVAAVERLLTH